MGKLIELIVIKTMNPAIHSIIVVFLWSLVVDKSFV